MFSLYSLLLTSSPKPTSKRPPLPPIHQYQTQIPTNIQHRPIPTHNIPNRITEPDMKIRQREKNILESIYIPPHPQNEINQDFLRMIENGDFSGAVRILDKMEKNQFEVVFRNFCIWLWRRRGGSFLLMIFFWGVSGIGMIRLCMLWFRFRIICWWMSKWLRCLGRWRRYFDLIFV